jgi:hypothetical protein
MLSGVNAEGVPLRLRACTIAAADDALRVWAQPQLLLRVVQRLLLLLLLMVHVSMVWVVMCVAWVVVVLLLGGLWDLAGLQDMAKQLGGRRTCSGGLTAQARHRVEQG